MAKLRLISLHCTATEDFTGPDEAFLRLNGITIWGVQPINDGQTLSLSSVAPVPFSGTPMLELWDQDNPALGDGHDLLGSWQIDASTAGTGDQSASFTDDGADYTLTYQVIW